MQRFPNDMGAHYVRLKEKVNCSMNMTGGKDVGASVECSAPIHSICLAMIYRRPIASSQLELDLNLFLRAVRLRLMSDNNGAALRAIP